MIDTQLCDISVLPRIILKINTKMSQKKDQRDYKSSISLSQIVELASLGIRQSPLGLMEILPTFGPSGRQEVIEEKVMQFIRPYQVFGLLFDFPVFVSWN